MSIRFALILAGGKGNHLSVLSIERAKAAVPFGGFYRLIDFPLSNCINSGKIEAFAHPPKPSRPFLENIDPGREAAAEPVTYRQRARTTDGQTCVIIALPPRSKPVFLMPFPLRSLPLVFTSPAHRSQGRPPV